MGFLPNRQDYLANISEQRRIANLPFKVISGVVVHEEGNKRYVLTQEFIEDHSWPNNRMVVEYWEVE
jgi:hypothetical protein